MIKVLIVGNYPVFLAGMQALAAEVGDLDVIERPEGDSPPDNLHPDYIPDVLLILSGFINLPILDAADKYKLLFSTSKLLVVFSHKNEHHLQQLLANGIIGCLLIDESIDRFFEAIRAAVKGEPFISQRLLSTVIFSGKFSTDPANPSLTEQETKILELVAAENTNREIAHTLFISERTVCNYLERIHRKLDTKTRAGSLFRAIQLGIIST